MTIKPAYCEINGNRVYCTMNRAHDSRLQSHTLARRMPVNLSDLGGMMVAAASAESDSDLAVTQVALADVPVQPRGVVTQKRQQALELLIGRFVPGSTHEREKISPLT